MQGEQVAFDAVRELIAEPGRPVQAFFKRTLDLLLGGSALVLLSPVLLAIAVWIKLDSRGPALFTQERLGRNLKPFTMYKFRTMEHQAPDALHRAAVQRTAETKRSDLPEDAPGYKAWSDPRITRAGHFLRKWSLDELANLINIVKGDMSLVGPRPALDYELPYYKDWFYQRFAVKPGLTGIWQVERTKAEDFDDMMRMDLRYVETFGVPLDVKLILLTIPAVIRERGRF
jgi:lipopolysaccharide/colanic/teichoic acid biosynthesis glycosyltransferase